MKQALLITLTLATGLVIGCKDVESNDPYIRQMEDSLFKAFPTVNRVSIEVKEYQDVLVTLGDAELYNGSEDKRKAVADQIGRMTIHFFDKNNYLDEGRVTFVAEETTMNVPEGSQKVYDMKLKELKNAAGK
jgi:hypothetical protein